MRCSKARSLADSPDAGNVRLDAQLIAAGSGETIWSGVIRTTARRNRRAAGRYRQGARRRGRRSGDGRRDDAPRPGPLDESGGRGSLSPGPHAPLELRPGARPPRARSRSSARSKSTQGYAAAHAAAAHGLPAAWRHQRADAQRRPALGARGDPAGIRERDRQRRSACGARRTSSSSTTGTGAVRSASIAAAWISIPGSCPRATTMRRCWRRAGASTRPWRSPKRRCASTRNRPRRLISHGMLLYYKRDFSAAEAGRRTRHRAGAGKPAGYRAGGARGGSAGPLRRGVEHDEAGRGNWPATAASTCACS